MAKRSSRDRGATLPSPSVFARRNRVHAGGQFFRGSCLCFSPDFGAPIVTPQSSRIRSVVRLPPRQGRSGLGSSQFRTRYLMPLRPIGTTRPTTISSLAFAGGTHPISSPSWLRTSMQCSPAGARIPAGTEGCVMITRHLGVGPRPRPTLLAHVVRGCEVHRQAGIGAADPDPRQEWRN